MSGHRDHWVIEACISPGERRLIWMGRAHSAEEAFIKARNPKYFDPAWTALCAWLNYVITGKSEPVIWE